jgi:hypothetical protein
MLCDSYAPAVKPFAAGQIAVWRPAGLVQRLVPIAPAGDRTSDTTQEPECRANHQEDDAKYPQQMNAEDESEDKQNDSEGYHNDSVPMSYPLLTAGIELGCGK